MANNNGKEEVNEELPDEHEVIQHSIRGNADKQPEKWPQDQQKHDGARDDKPLRPATGPVRKQ